MSRKGKKKHTIEPEVWDSGLSVEKPCILIHPDVPVITETIQAKVGRDEFSILLKGEWTEHGWEVGSDFIIPKQEVSGGSVDFKEDLHQYKVQGYNTVVHSHPFSTGKSKGWFSLADEENINSNFDCSILYTTRLVLASMRVQVAEGILIKLELLEKDIIVLRGEYDIPEELFDSISKRPITTPYRGNTHRKNAEVTGGMGCHVKKGDGLSSDGTRMKFGDEVWVKQDDGSWARALEDKDGNEYIGI